MKRREVRDCGEEKESLRGAVLQNESTVSYEQNSRKRSRHGLSHFCFSMDLFLFAVFDSRLNYQAGWKEEKDHAKYIKEN